MAINIEFQQNTYKVQDELCKKFAAEYNIPLGDIYSAAEENFKEILEDCCQNAFKEYKTNNPEAKYEDVKEELEKQVEEDAKIRSLIRGRSVFKRKALRDTKTRKNGIPGFILLRFRDSNFDQIAFNKTKEYVMEHGVDAAKELGCIDEDGNYVYSELTTAFSEQYGQKIDKNLRKGSAIGFFEFEEGKYEPRFIRIGYAQNKIVPVCQQAIIEVIEGKNPQAGPMFPKENALYYNHGITDVINPVVSKNFAALIIDLCEKYLDNTNFVNSYEDLVAKSEQLVDNSERNTFVGISAVCSSVGQPKQIGDDIPVNFEIYDGDGTIHTISVFVPEIHYKGMPIIEGKSGLLFLTDMYYQKNSGDLRYHLGGFLPVED